MSGETRIIGFTGNVELVLDGEAIDFHIKVPSDSRASVDSEAAAGIDEAFEYAEREFGLVRIEDESDEFSCYEGAEYNWYIYLDNPSVDLFEDLHLPGDYQPVAG